MIVFKNKIFTLKINFITITRCSVKRFCRYKILKGHCWLYTFSHGFNMHCACVKNELGVKRLKEEGVGRWNIKNLYGKRLLIVQAEV